VDERREVISSFFHVEIILTKSIFSFSISARSSFFTLHFAHRNIKTSLLYFKYFA